VFLDVVNPHAMLMNHDIKYGLPSYIKFSTSSLSGTNLEINLLSKMFVLNLCGNFVKIISHSKVKLARYDKNLYWYSPKRNLQ